MHWTFLFLFLYIPFAGKNLGLSTTGLLFFGLITLLVFLCVVMHEYGHALTARKYGIQTNDIILTPIGGIARLEEMPKKPTQEIIVALAGPAVNVAIVVLIALYIWLSGGSFLPDISELELIENPTYLPLMMMWFNGMLLGFNMIPAFPMDGGRVLRAGLSYKLARDKATLIAARIGQLLALGFLGIGIWQSQYSLAFIGLFIFYAAQTEYKQAKREAKITNARAQDIMRTDFTTIPIDLVMSEVFNHFGLHNQKDFLLRQDNEGIVGVLHKEFIESAMTNQDYFSPASRYRSSHFERVFTSDSVMKILKLFQNKNYSIVPVYNNDNRLVGTIDRENILDFVNRG